MHVKGAIKQDRAYFVLQLSKSGNAKLRSDRA